MRTYEKAREQAIRDWAKVSPELQRLINLCTLDLYFGPIGPVDDDGEPWPGFGPSCDTIARELPSGDLWVYEDGLCVCDSEPEWRDPSDEDSEGESPEDWYHYDACDVKRILVGKELARYV